MTSTLIPVRRETRDLWDMAGELQEVFDSEVEAVPRMIAREGLWHPTMDVYSRPSEMIVELEVPGVEMKDVKLTVRENHLIVEGSRRPPEARKEEDRYLAERDYGAFHRVIHLPTEVDTEKAEARLHEGVLTIRLPKSEREGGKSIKIRKE